MSFVLHYGLFTESFEIAPDNEFHSSFENDDFTPYDKLISKIFPVQKYPDMDE